MTALHNGRLAHALQLLPPPTAQHPGRSAASAAAANALLSAIAAHAAGPDPLSAGSTQLEGLQTLVLRHAPPEAETDASAPRPPPLLPPGAAVGRQWRAALAYLRLLAACRELAAAGGTGGGRLIALKGAHTLVEHMPSARTVWSLSCRAKFGHRKMLAHCPGRAAICL